MFYLLHFLRPTAKKSILPVFLLIQDQTPPIHFWSLLKHLISAAPYFDPGSLGANMKEVWLPSQSKLTCIADKIVRFSYLDVGMQWEGC